MNDNYLLHNETAKRLYFEYAKDLPIINLSSSPELSEQRYNNITEAFLLNDPYKLEAMRECAVQEKYILGDASDYEKFKKLCSVLPKFAGHPLYLLAHAELKSHFDCELEINGDNCDLIWQKTNAAIIENNLTEKELVKRLNIETRYSFARPWMEELASNEAVTDLASLERALIRNIEKADKNGCRIALYNAFSSFVRPNPYTANEIIKRMKAHDKSIELEDCELVDMQIARDIGIEYKKLGWTWLLQGNRIDGDALKYLNDSGADPKIIPYIQFEIGQSSDFLELQLRSYASKRPIGELICTVNSENNSLCYARNDYFRRVLCNIVGEWAENGEYTGDEKAHKALIQDILYYNLKKAIG